MVGVPGGILRRVHSLHLVCMMPRSAQDSSTPVPSAPEHRYQGQTFEVLAKIAVNSGLIVFGLMAVGKILPYQMAQAEKLAAMEMEVAQMQQRVNQLQAEYELDSQPHATRRIAQEEGNMIGANQRRVIWIDPEATPSQP